jgi:short-subunit dehydrogenase
MGMNLVGTRALVTGASSGIGRAIALELAETGATLAIAGRNRQVLEALASVIADAGARRPAVLVADLAVRGEAERLATRATEALGGVDLLINSAGVGLEGTQAALGDADQARAQLETNYWSPLALVSALVPAMRARGQGAVVNIASLAASAPLVLAGHYSSSKAALAHATEILRVELKGSGIDVMLVLPGPVETPMLAPVRAEPGAALFLRLVPPGNPTVLARRIVRGLRRGQRTLVYSRALWIARLLPTLALWLMPRLFRPQRLAERAAVPLPAANTASPAM